MTGRLTGAALLVCCVVASGCIGPSAVTPGSSSSAVSTASVGSETSTSPASAITSSAAISTATTTPPATLRLRPLVRLHHPAVGSAERKAILDGLRPVVQRDLGQKVIFEVEALNVAGGYAFADVIPRRPSGAKIDYNKTRYRREIRDGVFDGGGDAPVFALLKNDSGGWKVLTFVIGPTDVAYADWWREFKAPKAIFPYTE